MTTTRTALIIGANGGIGGALAARLAGQPHHDQLVLTARDPATITQTGGLLVACDVLDENGFDAALAAAGDTISALAYCVGSIVLKPLKATKESDFIDAFRLNVLGAATLIRRALPALKNGNASIVLFSTIAVQQGFTNHSVISAAKGGVEGLTLALAAELAPHIRVNCIAPSLTDTKLAAPLTQNENMAQSIAALHPIPRLGTAEDSAALADFLLSPASSWITGQIMHVDGGRSTLRVKG